jgi:hypothetical protein
MFMSYILLSNFFCFIDSSIERKPRVLRFETSKGEAVVDYCEPLATKKMGILGFPNG